MKRASPRSSPLFSPSDRWSLEQPPARRPIATIHVCTIPLAEQGPLALALQNARPLVWGDHQGMAHQPTPGADPVCLPNTETLPPLFQRVGPLNHIGQRAEHVLLDAASDPTRFLAALNRLLGPAQQLAKHRDITPTQRNHLERLPMTALVIAHQQGLTQHAQCLEGIAALALAHNDGLEPLEQWLLLCDLETALQDHADTHGALISQLRDQRQTLETIPLVADFLPQDPRTLGQGASLDQKKACLNALVNQPPPCGPFSIAQWTWAAEHWTESELRRYLLDGVTQLLTEAAKGVRDENPFRGTFLFERFPEDLLRDAFYCVGDPDNARLLQVKPLTECSQTLLNHYLHNEDIPAVDRERLRAWHRAA